METTSLNMSYTTPLGKKASRAFTNVDPNATDSELANFSEAMNDLTTNTLTSTSKITKKDIDISNTYYKSWVSINIIGDGKTPTSEQSYLIKIADGEYNVSIAGLNTDIAEACNNPVEFYATIKVGSTYYRMTIPLSMWTFQYTCPTKDSVLPVMHIGGTEQAPEPHNYNSAYIAFAKINEVTTPGETITISFPGGTYDVQAETGRYTIDSAKLILHIVA